MRIKVVVIDEIHLIVDWGRSFRKGYSLLKHFRNRGSGALQPWDLDSFGELVNSQALAKIIINVLGEAN